MEKRNGTGFPIYDLEQVQKLIASVQESIEKAFPIKKQ